MFRHKLPHRSKSPIHFRLVDFLPFLITAGFEQLSHIRMSRNATFIETNLTL